MMNSNDNFLLKIHMEEEGLKEIFLNKEGHSYTFVDEECVSDLIVPEFKITSLKMILKNIDESKGEDNYYAEYELNGETVREYDREKISLLINMVTSLTINEFLDYQKNIKIDDYAVDNVIDTYDCNLPNDFKKLISYTVNGVLLSGNYYLLSHEDIISKKDMIENFIPIIIKNDTNYIGYDYKVSKYKEYFNDKKIEEAKTLRDLILTSEIEVLNLDDESSLNTNDDISLDDTIKNINLQFERLNNGIIEESEIEKQEIKKKNKEEKEKIKQEIRDSIISSIKEIEETNSLINEIDSNIERVVIKKNNINNKKDKNKKKDKIKNHKIKENVILEETDEKDLAFINSLKENFHKAEEKKKEEMVKNIKESIKKTEELVNKLKEKERLEKEEQERKDKEKLRLEKEKQEQKEKNELTKLLIASLNNGLDNYKINFSDTQNLVLEHLPYYEFTNNFNVIQIPEIEIEKITLLPNAELDLGKIKLVVDKLTDDEVDLLIKGATSIIDVNNNKVKPNDHIILNIKDEITLKLNKKNAMETWTFKLEKSTFEKELRNIDYLKILNLISKVESFKKLGNIEKYELKKSVMLFIDLVMKNKEEKELEKLYEVLEKEPTLYEEFITKYNISHALELKNSLSSYEAKKEFITKLNYVNGLIDAKWLDYPRYIFQTHNYFGKDIFLEDYIYDLNNSLNENDFADYLNKLFEEYDMFINLDEDGKENLNKCLEYLSLQYKNNPCLGEKNKYQIEKTFMIGGTEEDIALLISKLCRRGIKDYSLFVEYDNMMKENYRHGLLKYPIYSDAFGLEEVRKDGEYDEF